MPVYILTAQLRDEGGQVVAVKQAPFLVLDPGESSDDAIADLQHAADQLTAEADELQEAAKDRESRHRRWWL